MSFFSLYSTSFSVGPGKNTTQNTLGWFAYFGTHRIADKYSIWTELQLRRSDFLNVWQQSFVRTALMYHFDENTHVALGYGYFLTYPYGEQAIALDEPRPEHRPWQQLNLKNVNGSWEFQHRFRLEQRLLQNWTSPNPDTKLRSLTDGYELQNRLRYRFLASLPLTRDSEGNTFLFATGYNEVFVNFGGNIGYNIFDQNRFGITAGINLSKMANVQIGYMNQTIQKSNGRDVEGNNALTLFLTWNTDWRN